MDLSDALDKIYWTMIENADEDDRRKLDAELAKIPASAARRDRALSRQAYDQRMREFWAAGAALS
jgi:hypothetical protein